MGILSTAPKGSASQMKWQKKNKIITSVGKKPQGVTKNSPSPTSPLPITEGIAQLAMEQTLNSGPGDTLTNAIEIWNGSYEDGAKQLSMFALLCTKPDPQADRELFERRRKSVIAFLSHLEFTDIAVPTALQNRLARALKLYSPNPPLVKFLKAPIPEDIRTRVNDILEVFNERDWGNGNGLDNGNGAEGSTTPTTTTPAAGSRNRSENDGLSTAFVDPPPPDHPIWGVKGIMYGFIRVKPPKNSYSIRFNPALQHIRRNAKVFGHNGLTPGDWLPSRMAATFHGAHDHNVKGICGTPSQGAWSIVVSGSSVYSNLDRDEGDKLFYSADGSDKNTDRQRVIFESDSTRALAKSLETQEFVRVLRSAGTKRENHHCPSVGVRYDGLYRVVNKHERCNDNLGKYWSFELHRVEEQRSLEDIKKHVPTKEQIADEKKIKEWY
ncbi:PUA-like domain-containing protein [Podospora fimiseda]|uniref:PUA-like domain-containing protein n=1 Tax=Podospora fimiseda TaxID=252190 RepID=A0AAN7BEH4_9PEZI|nr:PUA-like domain-containing protein [Podospora fimiseda]